jgi:DNA invertase Pin-like site-specific DNA recombinase
MSTAEAAERKIRVIPATLKPFGKIVLEKKENTGAYARVSTKEEEQESSFERQVEYYTEFIKSNPAYNFVGIFSDPGISGTRAKKRPGFLNMIEECRKGNIDRILVKSIARFARNTVDALTYIRELKELGVAVYFENEKIDTLTPGGEVLITILAGMAEQESRNISHNILWANEKKLQKGEVHIATKNFLGYTRDKEGKVTIEPNQAVIVRRIYKEFIMGYACHEIGNRLMSDGIPTPGGKEKWTYSTIISILTNISYMGDTLTGKTYKVDVLSDKRLKNLGQRQQYYIPDSHPAIISKELFENAQTEYKRRQGLRGYGKTGKGKNSAKHTFSSKAFCGECGAPLRRQIRLCSKREQLPYWGCSNHIDNGKDTCPQHSIKEEAIEQAFMKLMKQLTANAGAFIKTLKENLTAEISDTYHDRIERIDTEIEQIQAKVMELTRQNRQGAISSVYYETEINALEEKISGARAQQSELVLKSERVNLVKHRAEQIGELLTNGSLTERFDPLIFREIVDSVILKDKTLIFKFGCGLELTAD